MPKTPQALSVSQLNRQAKYALEGALPNVWVEGELTNFVKPSSGHWYFTLKDSRAQVRCAMFRGRNMLVRTPLRAGDKVLVNASVSLYEGRGDYQLIVDSVQKAGLGDLHQQYEALKAKLGEEGLFDSADKRPLPAYPQCIGVISSPTGAVVHDVVTVLKKRFPGTQVIIYPAQVQGQEAPASLLRALNLANRQGRCDTLIIGRGGGSLEDLWAFNNEALVRAVYKSKTPIISAVGHEVDVTLTDFAADLRAPTPSAAAEAATPSAFDLQQRFHNTERRLCHLIASRIQESKRHLIATAKRLQHPSAGLANSRQQVDQLELRLQKAMRRSVAQSSQTLTHLSTRLGFQSPASNIQQSQQALKSVTQRLLRAVDDVTSEKRVNLANASALLNSLSPLNTLQRGYSITREAGGKVVSSKTRVNSGQRLSLQFYDGAVKVTAD